VEKVSPDLVIHDANHQAFTVRYEAVNAMLLNEFRKQHERVEEQAKTIEKQQNEIQALKARQGDYAALAARLDALEKEVENW
jgi:polyhydroxyalkanoate synthesis regulator phasin